MNCNCWIDLFNNLTAKNHNPKKNIKFIKKKHKKYYDKKTKKQIIPNYYYYSSFVFLPKDISILEFEIDSIFNKKIINLPSTITHLIFGKFFNQPLLNLPINLTNLTFGKFFNQTLLNLPINLTNLTFGNYFNQPLLNLPINLTNLNFINCSFCEGDFCQEINLPYNLKKIKIIGKKNKNFKINKIPLNCKIISNVAELICL